LNARNKANAGGSEKKLFSGLVQLPTRDLGRSPKWMAHRGWEVVKEQRNLQKDEQMGTKKGGNIKYPRKKGKGEKQINTINSREDVMAEENGTAGVYKSGAGL